MNEWAGIDSRAKTEVQGRAASLNLDSVAVLFLLPRAVSGSAFPISQMQLPRTLVSTLIGVLAVSAQQITPDIHWFGLTNGRPELRFQLAPSVQEYRIRHSESPGGALSNASGILSGGVWTGTNAASGPSGFYQVEASPLPSETVLAGALLNRIAYGPTPDELDRIRQIGTSAYIAEQLAPEGIAEELDQPADTGPIWRKVTVTGNGSSSRLYMYLDGPGDAYLDDFRLVAGSVDNGTAANLLPNGGFESPLGTSNWRLTANSANSARTADYVRSGQAAFHLEMIAAGSTGTDSVYLDIVPSLSAAQTYTLSFWYLTSSEDSRLVVRLSGSGVSVTTPLSGGIESPAPFFRNLSSPVMGSGGIGTLRSWHLLHAIQSRRQLAEVVRQFLENHFVTQYSKTSEYLDNIGLPSELAPGEAAKLEFRENLAWRRAFLNPRCTFLDLLRISAESPAMIIYLDTVGSRGDINTATRTNRIANENYARELCELFAFGVDNGYDQGDIVQISRAWTGWTVDYLDTNQVSNPFAVRSTRYINASLTNATERNSLTNLVGQWSFRYRTERHDPRVKWIFYEKGSNGTILTNAPKTVPARFGAPWAGRNYGLRLAYGSGTNNIQDGYAVLAHMADQPFTQEYLSVKLCRLLVHDEFHHGYDFSDDVHTPEEDLVHACMMAWESPRNGGPKGQVREVLRVILESDLFRSSLTASSKVRTPLEFGVATLRAFRSRREDGTFTSVADPANLSDGLMNRAGRMRLFDRAEPDGYPEDGSGWISAGTLAERLRFAQSLSLAGANLVTTPAARSASDSVGSSRIDPAGLVMLKLGSSATSAEAVADYLMGLLYPTEGAGNLATIRKVAIDFLNTSDNGSTASAFSTLLPGSRNYDGRVRGLAALLLSTPRFQEQ